MSNAMFKTFISLYVHLVSNSDKVCANYINVGGYAKEKKKIDFCLSDLTYSWLFKWLEVVDKKLNVVILPTIVV